VKEFWKKNKVSILSSYRKDLLGLAFNCATLYYTAVVYSNDSTFNESWKKVLLVENVDYCAWLSNILKSNYGTIVP